MGKIQEKDVKPPEGLPSDPSVTFDPLRPADEDGGTPERYAATWLEKLPDTPQTADHSEAYTGIEPPLSSGEIPLGAPLPFQLTRLANLGGFGEIWEAVQLSLGRTIAVKKIRENLLERAKDNPRRMRHLERLFRQEALTTANLDHPNILPIHDLGLDDYGHPLLATKFVHGKPWDEIIRDDYQKQNPTDFLAHHLPTLISVCHAVAFAHSRGLIHRDIKPSQVMVGEYGEVLLMDWGLAMASDEAALQKNVPHVPLSAWPTKETAVSPAGTPAFMAPEQTNKDASGLGPWTDVYLLGGTLYYLLTGALPHEGENPRQVFYHASIGKVIPPKERKPKREIPAQLADLAMRALSPAPEERPASAKEFLQGLQDYLTGSSRRRESAEKTDQVNKRLKGIVKRYDDYNDLANLLSMAGNDWPENPEVKQLRKTLFSRYATEALNNGDLLLARVQAERLDHSPERQKLLNDITRGEDAKRRSVEELEKAHADLREQHDRAESLLNFLLGNLHPKLEAIGRLDLLDAISDHILAYYTSMDGAELPQETYERRCEALRQAGHVKLSQGDLNAALDAFDEALRLSTKLTHATPDRREAIHNQARSHASLGMALRARGELDQATDHFLAQMTFLRRLLDEEPMNQEWQVDLAMSHYSLADALAVQGDLDGAGEHNEAFREIMEDLCAHDKRNDEWQRILAGAYADHGWLLRARSDLEGAYKRYCQALEIMSGLVIRHPSNASHLSTLAFFHNKLGWVLEARKDIRGAIGHYRSASDIMGGLVEKDESNAEWRRLLAISHCRAGIAYETDRHYEPALKQYNEAIDNLVPLAERAPKNIWNRHWLGRALSGEGRCYRRMKRESRAFESFLRAAEVLEPIVRDADKSELTHMVTYAEVLLHLGRRQEADTYMRTVHGRGHRGPEFKDLCKQFKFDF